MQEAVANATIYCHEGEDDRLTVGEHVALEDALINLTCGRVHIGAGTFCGHRVMILTGSHKLSGDRRMSDQGRDITIGEGVWLASGCIILGPCRIGDRCVIAAGAVVTKDCDAGWLYAGVPARKVKRVE